MYCVRTWTLRSAIVWRPQSWGWSCTVCTVYWLCTECTVSWTELAAVPSFGGPNLEAGHVLYCMNCLLTVLWMYCVQTWTRRSAIVWRPRSWYWSCTVLYVLSTDCVVNVLCTDLNSPQCHRFAAPILRLVMFSVVSIETSSLAQMGSSSKYLHNESRRSQYSKAWSFKNLHVLLWKRTNATEELPSEEL